MKSLAVRRISWHAQRMATAFGWPAMAALLVLVSCIALTFLFLDPLKDRIASIKRDAQALRAQSKTLVVAPKVLNPAEQLEAFYRFFPDEESVPDAMGVLYNAAALHNLNLDQADYHLSTGRDDKLMRYQIVLPVKGGYVQVRKFIAQALAEIPNLSLEGITFNRQKIGETLVDAQLTFTLYTRGE